MKYKNKKLNAAVKFVIGIIIISVLLYTVSPAKTVKIVSDADLTTLFLAFVTYIAILLIMALRWKNFLGIVSNRPIGVIFSLKMTFMGLFFAEFTPGRVGDVARVYIAKLHEHIPLSKGLPMFLVERFIDIGIIALLAIIASSIISESGLLIYGDIYLFFVIVTVVSIFSAVLIVISKPSIFQAIIGFITNKMIKRVKAFEKMDIDTSDASQNFLASLNELRRSKRVIIINVFLSIAMWFLHITRIYLVSVSLGADAGFKYFLFIVPAMYLLAIIPITVGGLGVMEVGAAALYALIGVPIEISIAIPLVDRLLTAPFYVMVGYFLSTHEVLDRYL